MSVKTLEQLLSKASFVLQKDKTILDFSNTKISKIGNIPSEISSQVLVLNLANNNLRQLQGIDQFKKLQSLSLANNKISKSQTLLIIKNLLHLKRFSLNGNPFLENPLTQEILTLLSSYENDLQILDFAFLDQNRQSLVNQHKRSKSQSRVLGKSQISKINSQEDLQKFSKSVQINKSVQKSKVSMLMSNMQQFIEQKHQSQEISSSQIDKLDMIPVHLLSSKDQMSFLKLGHESLTPMKKSPKFGSFSVEQKTFNSLNQTNKFQDQSTNVKARTISNSKIIQQSIPYQSKTQTKQEFRERISWEKKLKNFQKKSPQKMFKYQANNLKINLDLEHAELNYPSIIQKEDQDSYEIQFDFMSPKKTNSPQRKQNLSSEVSPSQQLKGLTHSYVKIQEDEVMEQEKEELKKKEYPNVSPILLKSPRPQISQGTLSFLTKNLKSQTPKAQNRMNQKIANKQNNYLRQSTAQTPMNLAKKGSLHQSTRYVVPQSNSSTAQVVISKLLNHKGLQQAQSFSFNFSLGQMLQNAQKFEKFYYTSLTRLKPTFSLLYSPFNSLKTQEKDLLLQELFRNHKQIFILLIKQFYSKEKLQEQLSQKSVQLQKAEQFYYQNRVLNEKIQQYQKQLTFQKNKVYQVEIQSKKLKRYIDQFEDILASRQKIINDSKRQYQTIHRALIKKQQLIQKSLNEDDVQEKIIQLSETRIKNKFIKLIQKKAEWTVKFHNFVFKRQQKQKKIHQQRERKLKLIIFQTLYLNLKKQKSIKQFIQKNNSKTIKISFQQWKIQAKIDKLQKEISQQKNTQHKKLFFRNLNQSYLNKKRNQKIDLFNKIRLQKKVFLKGFKNYFSQYTSENQQSQILALSFQRKNHLLRYFQALKILTDDQNKSRLQKKQRIQKQVILRREYLLFLKILQFSNKEQLVKVNYVQQNIIRSNQISLFLRNLKKHSQFQIKFAKDSKVSTNYKMNKIFNVLKKFTKQNLKIKNKFQNLTRKTAQERRLKFLIVQFRQKNLRLQVQKKKKQRFLLLTKQLIQNRRTITQKKSNFLKILDFKRGLKAKNELISLLRFENMRKKMNNKRLVMQEHYLIQESKYKESYELNILTMQQLKDEIDSYLRQIQFYKLQIQKLSQRELYILQQKQNCLLEIQSKQEENLQLKKAVLSNEQQLEELQRKYEKSLDMYAAAMDEINEREKKIDQKFYYNTMIPIQTGFQTTFRRDALQSSFNSLKR